MLANIDVLADRVNSLVSSCLCVHHARVNALVLGAQLLRSRGARRRGKGTEGGGEQAHRSLRPSADRPAQSAGSTHPPQTHRPDARCLPARRGVPRAVAAPSPAFLVSKSRSRLTQLQPGYMYCTLGEAHRVLHRPGLVCVHGPGRGRSRGCCYGTHAHCQLIACTMQ